GEDLEVGGLWLMPVFEAASYHGYDVKDYLHIADAYGGDDAFERFLAAAHQRGLRVLLDLPLNHTADEHPWFIKAKRAPTSIEGRRYIWADHLPSGYGFPWGGGAPFNVWHPIEGNRRYYYGAFGPQMPDLNWRRKDVKEHLFAVARYWLGKGVDGFRLDAIRYLVEDGPGRTADTPDTHRLLREFRETCKQVNPDCYLAGEAWTSQDVMMHYRGNGNEMDSCFDFDRAGAMLGAMLRGSGEDLLALLARQGHTTPDWSYLATFLSNHDQPRTATVLRAQPGRLRAAAALLLSLPGVPFIYYGEELGVTGDKPDPELRRPMPWTAGENGGFSSTAGWYPLPVDHDLINVDRVRREPDSLLNLYRRLIHLRQNQPALAHGGFHPLDVNPHCIGFIRDFGGRAVLVMINLSPLPIRQPGFNLPQIDQQLQLPGVCQELLTGEPVRISREQATHGHGRGMTGRYLVERRLEGYGCIMVPYAIRSVDAR
ncbi:DUF3459 domain-containing protein, partial [bacterium]|nr:DUF3459 domain-containing protein [candidate division CSSED10-310 bacterium]